MPFASVPYCLQLAWASWIRLWAGNTHARHLINSTLTGLGQNEGIWKPHRVQTQEEEWSRLLRYTNSSSSSLLRLLAAIAKREGGGGGEAMYCLLWGPEASSFWPIQLSHSFVQICNMQIPDMYKARQKAKGCYKKDNEQVLVLMRATFLFLLSFFFFF